MRANYSRYAMSSYLIEEHDIKCEITRETELSRRGDGEGPSLAQGAANLPEEK